MTEQYHEETRPKNPPAFNIPGAVVLLAAAMIAIHAVRTYVLDGQTDFWLISVFSFVPAFYHLDPAQLMEPLARYWSPVSYSFLHGDWFHLFSNLLWMVAFGSAVARRFGNPKFLLFMLLGSVAGAAAHYLAHPMDLVPVIGASGAVSACMGAAVRFAFVPGRMGREVVEAPALSLVQSLSNRTSLTFVAIWFGFNFLFGAGIIPLGMEGQIAWEAHMGGFLLGWLGFGLFDTGSPKKHR